jgi:hypothetical protein
MEIEAMEDLGANTRENILGLPFSLGQSQRRYAREYRRDATSSRRLMMPAPYPESEINVQNRHVSVLRNSSFMVQ